MKRIRLFSVLLVLALLAVGMTGCACEHEWAAADCRNPYTCKLCGMTVGEKLPLHQWQEATTEAPKTCQLCGLTEGDRIRTDPRFQTALCEKFFGTWEGSLMLDSDMLGIEGMEIAVQVTMTFSNDGSMMLKNTLQDPDDTSDRLATYMAEGIYAELESSGMSREQAEAVFKLQFGKDIHSYCKELVGGMLKGLSMSEEQVYYVSNGKLYTAGSWQEDMSSAEYSWEGDQLVIHDANTEYVLKLQRKETP